MSAWPKLSAPIHAGDNFRMARDLSAATRNRPPAKPTGAAYFLPRREARNQPATPDPPDYRYFADHDYSELSQGH